ncbi:MAG TPA: response regulator, partial [Longimicrobium sp.]|nr:response regulator [Longimicrobium sp.]
NAAKFTREGHITLEVRRERMAGMESVESLDSGAHDWMTFRVTDSGIGMSTEQILGLFQAFAQADASTTRKFGGTGLGLALTRRFCQMMGGDVTVHSVQDEGSVFTIKLPAAVNEARPVSGLVPGPPVPRPAGGGDDEVMEPLPPGVDCVLVIDDDPAQRELMQRFLAREGFLSRAAGSGEEGLRLARRLKPAAITLDVMMPEMDGWTVLAALKADPTLCDIPVIMLTMVDDPQRGFTLGAADFATKPVDRLRLSRILRKYSCPDPPCPVLVVEDDPATRAITRNILEKEGWGVREAENGRVALECLEKERPSLILLDLMMPEMDGFEFADQVRRHPLWRSIPIVVVTAHDLSARERLRLNGYVETILQKAGDSHEELLLQVRSLLDDCAPARATPPTGEKGA